MYDDVYISIFGGCIGLLSTLSKTQGATAASRRSWPISIIPGPVSTSVCGKE